MSQLSLSAHQGSSQLFQTPTHSKQNHNGSPVLRGGSKATGSPHQRLACHISCLPHQRLAMSASASSTAISPQHFHAPSHALLHKHRAPATSMLPSSRHLSSLQPASRLATSAGDLPGGQFGLPRQRRMKRCDATSAASVTLQLPSIQAHDHWGVWCVLLSSAAIGLWSERTAVGRSLSAPLVSTLVALALSNTGVIPAEAPAYALVNGYLLPLAVPLLLFAADLRRLLQDTKRLLWAFCLGTVGTVLGTFVAITLVPLKSLGADGWKVAAALMSRHIGGAVNYVAVTNALDASPSVVTAGLAADNLICAVYFTTVFALAAKIPPDMQVVPSGGGGVSAPNEDGRAPINVLEGSLALALASCVCVAGNALAAHLGSRTGYQIPAITAIVLALATLFPSRLRKLSTSAEGLATILMQIFFATIGASGSIAAVIRTAPSLLVFSAVQIAVHLAFILGVGTILGFERKELLLASNANVGGPSTAAGMATAKGWRSLFVPAVLVGILGYAIATFLSIYVGVRVLKYM